VTELATNIAIWLTVAVIAIVTTAPAWFVLALVVSKHRRQRNNVRFRRRISDERMERLWIDEARNERN
jgi:hypothetical protein